MSGLTLRSLTGRRAWAQPPDSPAIPPWSRTPRPWTIQPTDWSAYQFRPHDRRGSARNHHRAPLSKMQGDDPTETCFRSGISRSRFSSLWQLVRFVPRSLLLHAFKPLDDVVEHRRQEDAEG